MESIDLEIEKKIEQRNLDDKTAKRHVLKELVSP